MPSTIKNRNGRALVELIEIEKKALKLSEANTRIFERLLQSKRSNTRENIVFSILALNFICSFIALLIQF